MTTEPKPAAPMPPTNPIDLTSGPARRIKELEDRLAEQAAVIDTLLGVESDE